MRKKTKLILGIDEAGRGAVIGPLVIAGVAINKKNEEILKKIGVKDSKELNFEKRKKLAKEIEKIAENIVVMRIRPCRIDEWRAKKLSLDKLEAMKIAQLIEICGIKKVYLDALTSRPRKFKKLVESYLKNKKFEIIAKNFADRIFPVVSAASIIAKVERDEIIERIKKRVKYDFGVGYPHDEKTIKFLEEILKKKKRWPSFVRKSWITSEQIKENLFQKKLLHFLRRIK